MKLTRNDFPVIDLKANYGNCFRVKRDECGDQLISHKWGHFFAHSDKELACFIKGNRKFSIIEAQFPEIRATQRGDQEIIFIFDPALLPGLARALKASRKRQVSERERKRLADIGCGTQFTRSCRGYKVPFTEKSADFFPSEPLGMGIIKE